MKDNWFRLSRCAIEYYEDVFSTKYPFGKLDHVFAADYNSGAMENVGCILYNDMYI